MESPAIGGMSGGNYRSADGTSTELPLSAAQLGFWFAQQLDPQNAGFNVGEYLEIHGPIDPTLFQAALRQGILETDVLRIRLVERAGEPRQIIAESAEWSLPYMDVSGEVDPAMAALSWMSADMERPTDLLRGPLFAFALFKAAADRFLWYARYHHVALDGLSRSLIARRVADVYTALAGRSLPDGNVPGPLAAIVADDAAYRASDDFARDRQYWNEYLDDAADPTSIANGRFLRSSGLIRRTIHLHVPGTARLRALGRLSRVVTAATAIFVHRLTRAEDLVLGLSVAARSDETRTAAGMVANAVPLRIKVDPDARVGDFVAEVDRQIRAVLPHQRYRFTDLRRDLHRIDDDRPIFGPVVNIQPFDYGFRFAGAPVTLFNLSVGPVEDLAIIAYDHPGTAELRIDLDANPALYGADVLAGHGQHLLRLLETIADPDATIAHLDMLAPDERRQVLVGWNLTQADYPTERHIDELFANQTGRTPERVAAVFGDQRLSYAELNRRADGLAHRLRALGVGPDVLVAFFLERSLDMLVGMLGVLKAGGAYVPLDPTHPRNRLAYMLADAQPLVLLTQERLLPDLPPHRSHVAVIDAGAPRAARLEHAPAPGRARSRRDLAYVIYTSGSTGEPKGVEIEHRAVVNLLASMQRRPGLGAEDTMLAITTLAFDIAALEIFLPLTRGACVVIAASETIGDGVALAGLIERCGASVIQGTPTTLRMLLDAGWAGDPCLNILCGGEAWTPELASRLLPRCASLWNMYGPTETTVWSAVAKVEASQPIVIGAPIANTRFYVLDGALQPVPVGVPGELHIGGDGLARGYLHRPQLTRERFVTDPFAGEPGARMYCTGDMVRRLPDGTLEFLGRLDHQVKIRGHRIEPGEIEAALERHPNVKRCVVVAREDAQGDHRLVAYVIPTTSSIVPASELRLLLHETVPTYMIPAAFMSVASFPLTPSGKLDRKALPPDVAAQEAATASLGPRTPTEEVLARLWCEMLDLKQVSVRDNFFELGGHSLLAVRVIGRINETLGSRLGVVDMFRVPTIEALAASIERNRQAGTRLTTDKGTTVVQLQEGRGNIPVYFVDAGPDQLRFANLINEKHPVFAIEVRWPIAWRRALADNRTFDFPDMEQLAALYVSALRAHTSSSPCILVGHSLGGLIAFEVAHQFKRQRGEVAAVMLLDTWGRYPTFFEAVSFILRRGCGLALSGRSAHSTRPHLRTSWQIAKWFYWRIKLKLRSFFNQTVDSPSDLTTILDQDGMPVHGYAVGRLNNRIRDVYRPQRLEGRGVLFRANANALDESRKAIREIDGSLGWNDLFGEGLEIVPTTGDHLSIVRDVAHVAVLARQINEALDRHCFGEKRRNGYAR
jgi:nonribosomal peptide synthetase DhbF